MKFEPERWPKQLKSLESTSKAKERFIASQTSFSNGWVFLGKLVPLKKRPWFQLNFAGHEIFF